MQSIELTHQTEAATASLSFSPGSQQALGSSNRYRVLSALASKGPSTQITLSRSTGLSSATISNVVQRLRAEGQVSTTRTTSSGRRAVMVALNCTDMIAVGVELRRDMVRVVLTRPRSGIFAGRSGSLAGQDTPETGSRVVKTLLEELLAENGLQDTDIIGVGVALPPAVDQKDEGHVASSWAEGVMAADIETVLRELLDLPVEVDTTTNLSAMANARFHSCRNLLYLNIDTMVTAGLVLNGELHTGHAGSAGQIGHTVVAGHGLPCQCGNRDCLDTIASTTALLDALRRSGSPEITIDALVALASGGDEVVLRFLEHAAETAGIAAAGAANLINPQRIVIGGPLAGLGATILEPFSRAVLRYTVRRIGEITEICVNPLGEDVAAIGAAALVARRHGQPYSWNLNR